jgi:hypothetical protein
LEKTSALWQQLDVEGYTDGSVGALKRAGYNAWKNPVSDIAVRPPDGSFPIFYGFNLPKFIWVLVW